MTVKITKPEINVRAELNELKKPTGVAGEAMLRAETPQEQFQLIGAGRRNILINGGMQVWQRGTGSQAVSSGDYALADRWKYYMYGATATASQQSFTVGQTSVPSEPEYFLRTSVSANSGVSDYCILTQHIEGVRTAAGQTVTVSFWAKSSVNGNQIGVEFNQSFGGGGSARVTTTGGSEAVILSTEWQKYTVTKQIGSIAGKTIGSSDFFEFYFWMSSGSTYDARSAEIGNQSGDFDITGVQLELGKVATPFEHRSYGEELALCQRYFYRHADYYNRRTVAASFRTTATDVEGVVTFPNTMRTVPTFIATSGTDYYRDYCLNNGTNLTSVSAHNIYLNNAVLQWTGFSRTAGQAGYMRTNNAGATVDFDAEL